MVNITLKAFLEEVSEKNTFSFNRGTFFDYRIRCLMFFRKIFPPKFIRLKSVASSVFRNVKLVLLDYRITNNVEF